VRSIPVTANSPAAIAAPAEARASSPQPAHRADGSGRQGSTKQLCSHVQCHTHKESFPRKATAHLRAPTVVEVVGKGKKLCRARALGKGDLATGRCEKIDADSIV